MLESFLSVDRDENLFDKDLASHLCCDDRDLVIFVDSQSSSRRKPNPLERERL